MKILIFSGGSGSAAIQTGIHHNFPEADVAVITNGYDNGKSTGLIRTVFDGKILGPSDIRKNQLRYLGFTNKELANTLDYRFTSDEPQALINEKLESTDVPQFFKDVIDRYFQNPKAHEITYEDFSIGNIIYGQLAAENNNSMQMAADLIAKELDIRTDVIVNSDESLFLYAKTEANVSINDEADIVDYNRSDDRIASIGFYDSDNNHVALSKMNERACKAVEDADMIIFSSGTQWSSLIPTYQSMTEDGRTFAELIDGSRAKKYLVMNTAADKDMIGVTAEEIQDLINTYFNLKNVTTVVDENAEENLKLVSQTYPSISETLSLGGLHTPGVLMKFIFADYFNNPTKDDLFVFDWDDTIIARQGKNNELSQDNKFKVKKLNSYIISGNTHHHIDHNRVWADGGINYYEDGKFKCRIDEEFLIENIPEIKKMLIEIGFNNSMIQDRAQACISIKPVDNKYRAALAELINIKLPSELEAIVSGKTTIDIMNKESDKVYALTRIVSENDNMRIFYIGDEPDGNDKGIFEAKEHLGITFIHVKSVVDTSIFLKVIND